MLNSFWRLLKSGTDIRGVACENEAGEAVNLTDDAVAAIANGFLVWLEGRAGKQAAALRLAIGHDSRISAERIAKRRRRRFDKSRGPGVSLWAQQYARYVYGCAQPGL